MRELLSWLLGRLPSFKVSEGGWDGGVMMLMEEGVEEDVLLLLGGGDVIVGLL